MWIPVALSGWLCLMFALLCVPLDVFLEIDSTRTRRLSFRLEWLFGALKVRPGEGGHKRRTRKKARPERKRQARPLLRILRVEGLPSAFARLFRRLFGCLEVRDLRGELTIGLDDPADTGVLLGALIPAGMAVSGLTGRPFSITPFFEGPVFEGRAKASLRLFPIQALWTAARFLFSIPAMRALKRVIVSRWKRRT